MSKVNVYSLDGSVKEKINLPSVFNTEYRPDVIKKSFNVMRSNKRQPYGSDPLAGTRHAVASAGKGRGLSRVPRLTQGIRGALAPCVVGGRRAHPPKSERNWKEKINKKERLLARNSALAATANKDLVMKRGHVFKEDVTLPIIIDDEFERIKKTKDVVDLLERIGVYSDIIRAAERKNVRSGRGKMRGRKYRLAKSLLIISNSDGIAKAADNLPGVDVTTPKNLNIEHLAPGGEAGRLTIFTRSSLKTLTGGAD
jgi:large subunit ribosomal protein L4e